MCSSCPRGVDVAGTSSPDLLRPARADLQTRVQAKVSAGVPNSSLGYRKKFPEKYIRGPARRQEPRMVLVSEKTTTQLNGIATRVAERPGATKIAREFSIVGGKAT